MSSGAGQPLLGWGHAHLLGRDSRQRSVIEDSKPLAEEHGDQVNLDLAGIRALEPIRPLVKAEHGFARLGRLRRLSRCSEGSEASARAWREVASVGYLAWRAVA